VPPPGDRDYDVVIEPGALSRLGELVVEAAPAHRYAIIADGVVADLYGARARTALEEAGQRVDLFSFEAGEARKTVETWAALTGAMLEAGLGRDSAVVTLGGGVAGDLGGFVAATYMRGIPFVQVPTSLLAMVDASVGGKTGVDTVQGKNLVGAFHHPRRVVIDPELLRTLPDRELRGGLAEAVKHGAIADAAYLDWIEANGAALLARDPEAMAFLVRRSVEIKADFVSRDPLEGGPRKALNFGHTIGHAIEAATEYGIPHGYAVAIGMVAEARAGEEVGITTPGTADRLRRVLDGLGLPTEPPAGLDAETLVALMVRDKKSRAARPNVVYLRCIGAVARSPEGDWAHPFEDAAMDAALAAAGR